MSDDNKTPDEVFEDAKNKSQALAVTLNAISNEQLELTKILSNIDSFYFNEKLSKVAQTKMYADIKAKKLYKGMVRDLYGNWVKCNTWEEFCRIRGSSKSTINEDIQNLSVFGEDFLEASNRLGLGPRDLRKLRKLDVEQQKVIVGEVEANFGDKDAIVELIEGITVKHAKENAVKDKEIAELKADAEVKEKILADKNKKIDELDSQLTRRENASLDDKTKDLFMRLGACEIDCITALNTLDSVIVKALEHRNEHKTLEHRSAMMLFSIRNKVDDLLALRGLEHVDANQAVDFEPDWMAEANAEIEKRQKQNNI